MTEGLKTFHIYDNSANPPILKGTVRARHAYNETAEEAAQRRGRQIVGHDNFSCCEVKESLPDKVARVMDKMAELFRDY